MKRWMIELWMRFRALLRRNVADRDIDAEVQHHLEMEAALLVEQGLSPRAAKRQAALAFGGRAAVREECRDERGVSLLEDLARDVRLGTRSLIRAPRFTVASLLSLTLGVGAATVIFAIVDAVILRPLPYDRPEELVRLFELTPEGDLFSTSDLNVLDFRARSQTLTDIAALAFPIQSLLLEAQDTQGASGEAMRLRGTRVTGNFFDVMGVQPTIGRSWSADETAPGERPRSVVIGHGLWQRTFGGDETLVGEQIRLGGEAWTVLGVLPPGFRFADEVDLWLPYPLDRDRPRGDHRLEAVARLAPGISLDVAEQELLGISAEIAETYPEDQAGWSVDLQSVPALFLGDDTRSSSAALVVAVGLLLLLACANVTSLLLARATGRVREMAMRRALGARRSRLVRQLLAESLALGLVGAGAGLLLAAAALPLVKTIGAGALPRIEEAALDPRAAAVAAALALVTAVIFGTVPALQLTAGERARAGHLVRADAIGGASGGRRGGGLRAALVVGQLALALVLTSSSVLLLQSLGSLRAIPTGFVVDDLLAVDVTLPGSRYEEGSQAVRDFYTETLERIRALPGVDQAGGHTTHPFEGPSLANTVARAEVTEKSDFIEIGWRSVTPGAFRALGTPLLRGRDFREQESELVTVINASLAERLFGNEEAIGQQIRWRWERGPLARVIGVVADVRDLDVTAAPRPMFYWHQASMRWPDLTLLVRSSLDLDQLAGPLRAAVREVDPFLPPPEVSRVRDDLRLSLATPQLNFRVFTAFAAVAVVIAVVGLYGLIAYSAARRRGEMGVRMALGAQPRDIGRLLVGQGVRLVTLGLLSGLTGVWAVSTLLYRLLHERSALDLTTLALSACAFALVSLVACLVPAIRAARQSPVSALRAD